MTSTDVKPAPAQADEGEPGGWHWLDTAGIIAGLLLAVIIADIFSDGRLISRRLRKPGQEATPDAEQPGD